MNLDGVCLHVSATGERGVVSSDTRLRLVQKGPRLLGRYEGGAIVRGCLAGSWSAGTLTFRYVQRERSGEIHAGRSVCDVFRRADGGLRLVEHFTWTTRAGAGTNVFDE